MYSKQEREENREIVRQTIEAVYREDPGGIAVYQEFLLGNDYATIKGRVDRGLVPNVRPLRDIPNQPGFELRTFDALGTAYNNRVILENGCCRLETETPMVGWE